MVHKSFFMGIVLASLASALFGVMTLVSIFRRDGASALVTFAFAYIMFDMAKGLIRERRAEK